MNTFRRKVLHLPSIGMWHSAGSLIDKWGVSGTGLGPYSGTLGWIIKHYQTMEFHGGGGVFGCFCNSGRRLLVRSNSGVSLRGASSF